MNLVKKQKLFDEYVDFINSAPKNDKPSEQWRFFKKIEDFLESIYECGYAEGFEKGVNQSIDDLKK